MHAFSYLNDYDKSVLYFGADAKRRTWMQGLISRMRVSYSECANDFDWIMMYALCLYLKQPFLGRLPVLACVCIACKQLDDESWEIGSGDYERQIPMVTARELAAMERVILVKLGYRTLVAKETIEKQVLQRMIETGIACSI